MTARRAKKAGDGWARPTVTTSECTDLVTNCTLTASVIVPAKNCATTLGAQIAALAEQRFSASWEVIVIDNGSTDATLAVARAWTSRFPVPLVIASTDRAGVNRARNTGVGLAAGNILAFCDGDDEVTSGWLAALVEAAAAADLVGGPLDEETLNPPSRRARRPRFQPGGLPRALDHLDFVPGANLAIRSTTLAALGGFDEAFVLGQDDVDLAFRANEGGFRVAYAPDAVVAYRHRVGARRLFTQFVRYGRAEPLLYRRHRHAGLTRVSPRLALRRWASLLPRLPKALVDPRARGAWVVTAGFSFGRLVGSVEHRVLFL